MLEYPFRLRANIISRSKGHNAVAAAAYRSGELILDSDDVKHDYRRRHGVISTFMAVPREAPAWASNRHKLWDKVEKLEKRKDSQLAREIVLYLPPIDIFDHLTPENKIRQLRQFYEPLVKNYVKDNFVKEGMIADIALHEPSEKNDKSESTKEEKNYHAHIMLTMRRVNTASNEFGEKERAWNSDALLDGWRRKWNNSINTTLRNHNIDAFVDHRSYKERGLDIEATKPVGSYNHRQEKKGIKTKAGNHNRDIKARNKLGHKYLERLFEHSPMASGSDILAAIKKAGYDNAEAEKEKLEHNGMLIALDAKETRQKADMFVFAPMKKRSDKVRNTCKFLHKRSDYNLSSDIVQGITKKRGDKKIRDALEYVAEPQGFKTIEAEDNGHKTTFLSSCMNMYEESGYDVIKVARNNEGKDTFKKAGFGKGVLTYRDFLRRFGERYTGARSTKQKVIIIDEADQLSPIQDQEIFEMAQKINAKLIYVGNAKTRNKRTWQSQFTYYRKLTESKLLCEKFLTAQKRTKQAKRISDAFSQARIFEALTLQSNNKRAKYINCYNSPASAKQGLLDAWYSKIKKKHDNRFILTSSDSDAEIFNFAIQNKRLEKKHLTAKYGKIFSVAYPSNSGETLRRDMLVYRGEQIQFKKAYKAHGIEEGTRAIVRISYRDHSLLELDDGRVIKLDLQENNGFDLGYAGSKMSPSAKKLDQGYIYHSKENVLDDAPLLYQSSELPVKLFYSQDMADNLEKLSSQLLGYRHDLYQGFINANEAGQYEENEAGQYEDKNDILDVDVTLD